MRRALRILGGLGLGLLCAAAAQAEDIAVSGPDALRQALRQASPGDVLRLAPGDYGRLELDATVQPWAAFEGTVTVASADPERPATFARLRLVGIANLAFEGVVVDYEAAPGAPHWIEVVHLDEARNVAFRDVLFDGDRATGVEANIAGTGTGYGLVATDTERLTVAESAFRLFHRAGVFARVEDLTLRDNEITAIRSDGLNFVDVDRVLIAGNRIHGFETAEGSGDHADMIQFWTRKSSSPSTDVTIRDNVLDSADGDETQSIFMRNERVDRGKAGREMFYRDITIAHNVIRNAHLHGITVGETEGLRIVNNTVLHNAATHAGGSARVPKITVAEASRDVLIARNVAHGVPGARDGWRAVDNLQVQRSDPAAPHYYGDLFVDALADRPGDLDALRAKPGSPIAARSLGAERLQFDARPDALKATVSAERLMRAPPGTWRFDAGLSRGPDGLVEPGEATFRWRFPDGTTDSGPVARHRFASHGTHTVRLTVTLADGTSDTAETEVEVADPALLKLEPTAEGAVDRSAYDVRVNSKRLKRMSVPDEEKGYAIALGEGDAAFSLSRKKIGHAFGLPTLVVDLSLRATEGRRSAGELFRIHTAMRATVTDRGELRFKLNPQGGRSVRLETRGAGLLDGAWHDVAIVFDGRTGEAAIRVDGRTLASSSASGRTKPRQSWDLTVGAAYGKPGFTGRLSGLTIRSER